MGKLTAISARNLSRPGKHFDGHGLYLEITRAGGRYWRLKYRYAGKEKRLALGVYPDVSLKEARQRGDAAREQLQQGLDPLAERKAAKLQARHDAAHTLEDVARQWMGHQRGRWTAETARAIERSFELHVFPKLGSRPLAHILPREVQQVVRAVESTGARDMAGRVLQRIKSVYRWAVVNAIVDTNPMVDLVPGEILQPHRAQHRRALTSAQLPDFLQDLDRYDGEPITRLALCFLLLTATRPGEARAARWAEIDAKARMWTIPAERMKMRQSHQVPLSRQALHLLEQLRPLSGHRPLVFPSPHYPSKPLSENTFMGAIRRMGWGARTTAHGFRATFSTIANEAEWDHDVIERQLAHEERNKVRAAYHRSAYTRQRRKLLQWWADYLDQARKRAISD